MAVDPRKLAQQQSQHQGVGYLQKFHIAHERLKHRVHTSWRIPLPPWGQYLMGFVYFTIPIIVGYHTTTWAIEKSEKTKQELLASGGGANANSTTGTTVL
jgi:hypothetical protein